MKKKIAISIEESLLEVIDELAEDNRVFRLNRSAMIQELLVQNNQIRRRLTIGGQSEKV